MLRKSLLFFLICAVASPIVADTRSWTGNMSGNWSDPGNWSPPGLLLPTDTLVFPAGAASTTMTNDLPAGTSVGAMTFDADYTLNGNALTLTGDVTANHAPVVNADLKLGQSLRINSGGYPMWAGTFNGAIDVNGKTLTIIGLARFAALDGDGTVVSTTDVIVTGGSFRGTFNGMVNVAASLPNATVTGNRLSGSGTVGSATISGDPPAYGCSLEPGYEIGATTGSGIVGTLNTGSLSLNSSFGVNLDGTLSDRVRVTGTVTLGASASLVLRGVVTVGQTYEIIDNDGTDPVIGTFRDLPEGATFAFDIGRYRITYAGGDGNDVVLTVVSATKVWTGTVSGLWSDPRNWSPQAIPEAGEPLRFPRSVPYSGMINDLPAGMVVGPITMDTAYALNGNLLILNGDVRISPMSVSGTVWSAPLKLGTSLSISCPMGYFDSIDVNGQTLTTTGGQWNIGALNGSGAVVSQGLTTISGGTFSGSLTGDLNVSGSLPNATVASKCLSGVGTVGATTITGPVSAPRCVAALAPGSWSSSRGPIGTLHTGSLSLDSGLYIRWLYWTSSMVQVAGSVNLGPSASLLVTTYTDVPTIGTKFKIIDNDGADPVNGTFSGLPEGAVFGTDVLYRITYAGGDGNDVELTVVSSAKTWTGSVSGLWSDARNWIPQARPASGESLVFPQFASNRQMTNDLPNGMSVGAMTFHASYGLSGNSLTLMGDLAVEPVGTANAVFTCNADLKVGTALRIEGTYMSTFNGTIDVNGQTLTIAGSPVTVHALTGDGTVLSLGGTYIASNGTFSGTLTGVFDVEGSLPNASVIGRSLSGTGALGPTTISNPTWETDGLSPGVGHIWVDRRTTGTLRTGSLTLNSPLYVDLTYEGSDMVQVTGSVTLGSNASVKVRVVNGAPTAGHEFKIIDNDGTDPVSGTFSGLPEGATFTVDNAAVFRVTYAGGDGNDVVLTWMAATEMSVTQLSSSTHFGEAVTLSAVITSEFGVPSGIVTFYDGATAIGTAPLHDGTATFAIPTLNIGTHYIIATYAMANPWLGCTSNAVTHVVDGKVSSVLTATTNPATSYAGQPFLLTARVEPLTAATGSIRVTENTRVIATQPVIDGVATVNLSGIPGEETFALTYSGDANYAPASATARHTTVPALLSASDVVTDGETPHTIAIPVTLSAPQGLPSSVDYTTADDTAIAGTNYTSATGTLRFMPGQIADSVTLSIIGSSGFDAVSFRVKLSNAVNASIAVPSVAVTIRGNGTPATYEYAPGRTIDVYAPVNAKTATPVILWIPGMISYDSAADPIPALRETLRGYTVARVGYRPGTYPAPLDDLVAALAWIRGNAATLNIDPNRIGAWGFGAGAHLAMLLGENNHLQAVIDCSGATDLTTLDADALACSTVVHNDASSPESQLLGCALSSCSSLALSASPVANVGSDTAATLILHGDGDCTIAPVQALRMYDALRSHEIDTALFLVHGMGHDEVWNATGMPAEIDSFLDVHLKNLGARMRPSR